MSTYHSFAGAMRVRTGRSRTPALIRDEPIEQQQKRKAKEERECREAWDRLARDEFRTR